MSFLLLVLLIIISGLTEHVQVFPGMDGDGSSHPALSVFEEVSFVISGTSNVRDWEIHSDTMSGIIVPGHTFSHAAGTEPDLSGTNPKSAWFDEVSLSIPAKTLDSGIGLMNQTMHTHLKSEEYPTISYRLVDVEEVTHSDEPGQITVMVIGIASAAGGENEVRHEVTLDFSDPDKLLISGEIPMLMTDFGIEPPTFMRGALKTDDAMMITFRFAAFPEIK